MRGRTLYGLLKQALSTERITCGLHASMCDSPRKAQAGPNSLDTSAFASLKEPFLYTSTRNLKFLASVDLIREWQYHPTLERHTVSTTGSRSATMLRLATKLL